MNPSSDQRGTVDSTPAVPPHPTPADPHKPTEGEPTEVAISDALMQHAERIAAQSQRPMLANDHVQRRLAGEPHQHHRDCIHNLPPDEQIAMRGRSREWWVAIGLPIPEQITPADWATP